MKSILLPLLVSLALPNSESAFASLPRVFIKDCYDGDTCTSLKGEKIRLACIDTPELKGWNADPIPAKEARDFVNKLVANEEVSFKRITNDRYGRTIGELFKNEVNIQELIVEKGYGKIYKKYAHQCEWSKK
ncbi:thermonuclease family protein [uncultured Prochlorococcus sp.]|uniref:thermonuclease family protein n=1 Tax=uncultured Prochlorococcus sp. TaxID=159733 RepID=UPI00258BD332|nr:thermonuclease family protein [uncultured Prochlorococcus sp.]